MSDMNNFEVIDSFYRPRLKGIKTIGIGPAPRRVSHSNFENVFRRILDQLPRGPRLNYTQVLMSLLVNLIALENYCHPIIRTLSFYATETPLLRLK